MYGWLPESSQEQEVAIIVMVMKILKQMSKWIDIRSLSEFSSRCRRETSDQPSHWSSLAVAHLFNLSKKAFHKSFPVFVIVNRRFCGGRKVPLKMPLYFGISDVTPMKLEQSKPNIIHRCLRDIETAAKLAWPVFFPILLGFT